MKIAVVLSLGLLAVALMRRQAAATRHWTLAVTIACAAALPTLAVIAPAWQWPDRDARAGATAAVTSVTAARVADDARTSSAPAAPAPAAGHRQDWSQLGRWLTRLRWAGAGLGLFGLLIGVMRLGWIVRRATPVTSGRVWRCWSEARLELGLTRSVRLLQSDTRPLLMTWGAVRPTVIIPRLADGWSDARLRAVLLHELAHVQRGDWPALMLAEGLRAVDWMNPLTWIAARRLRAESELACDDLVLSSGLPAHEYAAHLLAMVRIAGADHRRTTQAMARPSGIERRVEAMLNHDVNRAPGSRFRRAAVAAALACATVAVAGYGLAAQTLTSASGVVSDPMHLGVARARVSLTETRTEARHEVTSDPTGRFEFAGLTPGEYQLETRVPGFAPTVSSVNVTGRHVTADVSLRLGALRETITLTRTAADAPDTTPKVLVMSTATANAIKPCQATTGGGNIRPPMKVRDVRPTYPDNAESAGGVVTVDVRIGTDGAVASAVAREPANPDLARAAVAAIEQWRFTPTLLNCVPVEVSMTASVTFGGQ
ncbi:MAG: M56 family metallopeptidase [Vicinamibacterales bacterium]